MRTIGACLVIIGLCIMLIGGMMEGWPIRHVILVELAGLMIMIVGAVIHNWRCNHAATTRNNI